MLLSITEKCCMGCSHCLDDARSDSENFITEEMFKYALDFNFKYDKTLMITGGEPTEHPQFWHFLDIIAERLQYNQVVTVMTNGMYLSDKDIPKVDELKNKCEGKILFQVSSIKPYYPIHIDLDQKIFRRKDDFFIVRKIERLEEIGRAAEHQNWIFTAKAPSCFNIRSITRTQHDFRKSVSLLRSLEKFCTPQIAYDGSIKVGESMLCPAVAHIEDSEEQIAEKISKFTCSYANCHKLLDKLPPECKMAIGEK